MVIFNYNLKTRRMKRVNLKEVRFSVETGIIKVSEKDVQFDTQYEVVSAKTGNSMVFNFSHSTGPEFDPTTEWVYTSQEGIEFRVCNDAHITAQNARAYVKAKQGRVS
jgi:hypothetical protein